MLKRFLHILTLIAFFFLFDLTFGYSVRTPHLESITFIKQLPNNKFVNDFSDTEDYARLDASINRFIQNWGVTGASVAVAKYGNLVYAKGFGYSNVETEEKMQPYHLLRVASVSKLITAVAVMKLVEEGKLCLNQKVFGSNGVLNILPYTNFIDDRIEEITVNHLLNHSAGWTTRWGDHLFMHQTIARQLNKELPIDQNDIIAFALSRRLHFNPGTMSSYNNLGFLILEQIIEISSGQAYEAYVLGNVFGPLGIYDAFIAHNFDSLRYPLEVRYYEVPEAVQVPAFDGQQMMVLKSRGGNDVRTLGAAGGWVISSVSLVRFLMAIDLFSKKTILSKKSIRMLERREAGVHPLGWRWVSSDGSKWRTGSFAGTSALAISRSDGFSYVFITNTSPWIGARFPYEVNGMMSRAIQSVDNWYRLDIGSPNLARAVNYVEWENYSFNYNKWNGEWGFPWLLDQI